MPVYDRGYTHWEPSGGRALPAWLVIARRGIIEPLKRRMLLLLLVLAWLPAFGKGVVIYLKLRAGELTDLIGGDWSSIDAGGFLSFLEWQRFFVFTFLAIIGAGLIASDRRDNGLSLYFSRPLDLPSYVGGKTLIILFYYFMVTLFPVYALCLFSYLIAPDATGMSMLLLTPLRATLYCALSGISMALVLLSFSSMGTRSIFVMVWWTILIWGTEAIGAIARGLGKNSFEALNFLGQYHNAGSLLFGADPSLGINPWISLVVVTVWTALAVFVLRKNIRPVEVVS